LKKDQEKDKIESKPDKNRKRGVPSAFVAHYEAFLGQSGSTTPFNDDIIMTKLDNDLSLDMIKNVTVKEVKDAMFSIGNDKSPGPDGYTACFFKESWDIVANDVTCVVQEFFTNGNLLKELNHTIIALVPKVKSPTRINDYRPISCCNVLFKCITKIISNRIKECLKVFISPNQSAFVPDKRIYDNILLTQELMHNYHLDRGSPRCAFKVDIQKAYDTVDWVFLKQVLLAFGFHEKMVSWIMECVTTTTFSVSINGSLHGYFKGERGLRQETKRDDLFIFAHGDPSSAKVIMEAMDEFKNVSGLVPSLPKSTAYFCNVLNHYKLAILQILPFEEGRLSVKHLGVPLVSLRLVFKDSGRLQLVRSVLGSMHIYWASVFILPSQVIFDIEQLMRGFLWCHGDMSRGKAKVSWEVHLAATVSNRHIYRAGFTLSSKVSAAITNGEWSWPDEWLSKYPHLNSIAVPLLSNIKDKLEWHDSMGNPKQFSVREVWNSIRPRSDVVDWYNVVWFPNCIPSHAFHLWLVAKRRLKTQDRLRPWDIIGNTISMCCPLCDGPPDSHDHLFYDCPYSTRVWNDVKLLAGLANVTGSISSIVNVLLPIAKRRTIRSVIGKLVVAASSYFIWQERNSRLFSLKKRTHGQLTERIKPPPSWTINHLRVKANIVDRPIRIDESRLC
nr:hypothetical protein [Tanacetum cinerariifolium]